MKGWIVGITNWIYIHFHSNTYYNISTNCTYYGFMWEISINISENVEKRNHIAFFFLLKTFIGMSVSEFVSNKLGKTVKIKPIVCLDGFFEYRFSLVKYKIWKVPSSECKKHLRSSFGNRPYPLIRLKKLCYLSFLINLAMLISMMPLTTSQLVYNWIHIIKQIRYPVKQMFVSFYSIINILLWVDREFNFLVIG